MPHAWVERDGALTSTLWLSDPRAFVLLLGDAGDAWRRAAKGLGLGVISIGEGSEVRDPQGEWAARREVSDSGAILLRPDGHVAWRAMQAAVDPAAELGRVLSQLLPA